jgi:hypothetical protein
MDWVTLAASAAAFVISSVCAALGYRRLHGEIPREVNAHEAAIVGLRRQNAALSIRLRALETAAKRQKGPTNGP